MPFQGVWKQFEQVVEDWESTSVLCPPIILGELAVTTSLNDGSAGTNQEDLAEVCPQGVTGDKECARVAFPQAFTASDATGTPPTHPPTHYHQQRPSQCLGAVRLALVGGHGGVAERGGAEADAAACPGLAGEGRVGHLEAHVLHVPREERERGCQRRVQPLRGCGRWQCGRSVETQKFLGHRGQVKHSEKKRCLQWNLIKRLS